MSKSFDPEQLVEHFFRHEYASLVAMLARTFGFALIDVIEDMVQEAILDALRSWRLSGAPDRPAAWLHRVARNKVIDVLRRQQRHSNTLDKLQQTLPKFQTLSFEPDELEDSLLKMIFTCCHPSLDRVSQLALTLNVACGLGIHEVARGLLQTYESVKKRITRAKRHLQLHQVSLVLPPPELINERLDVVHDVLYLMFNEGYSATCGNEPIRIDLCEEAARLCHLLCINHLGSPATKALLALMLYHASRLDARLDPNGAAILLAKQDRSKWDRDMIAIADKWLQRSATGSGVSRYHLEAGIARLHCSAPCVSETDWLGIAKHYELLSASFPSALYDLNRAIALGRLGQLDDAFQILRSVAPSKELRCYPLFHCALADLLQRNGEEAKAKESWQRALHLATSEHERNLINGRLHEIDESLK